MTGDTVHTYGDRISSRRRLRLYGRRAGDSPAPTSYTDKTSSAISSSGRPFRSSASNQELGSLAPLSLQVVQAQTVGGPLTLSSISPPSVISLSSTSHRPVTGAGARAHDNSTLVHAGSSLSPFATSSSFEQLSAPTIDPFQTVDDFLRHFTQRPAKVTYGKRRKRARAAGATSKSVKRVRIALDSDVEGSDEDRCTSGHKPCATSKSNLASRPSTKRHLKLVRTDELGEDDDCDDPNAAKQRHRIGRVRRNSSMRLTAHPLNHPTPFLHNFEDTSFAVLSPTPARWVNAFKKHKHLQDWTPQEILSPDGRGRAFSASRGSSRGAGLELYGDDIAFSGTSGSAKIPLESPTRPPLRLSKDVKKRPGEGSSPGVGIGQFRGRPRLGLGGSRTSPGPRRSSPTTSKTSFKPPLVFVEAVHTTSPSRDGQRRDEGGPEGDGIDALSPSQEASAARPVTSGKPCVRFLNDVQNSVSTLPSNCPRQTPQLQAGALRTGSASKAVRTEASADYHRALRPLRSPPDGASHRRRRRSSRAPPRPRRREDDLNDEGGELTVRRALAEKVVDSVKSFLQIELQKARRAR